MMHGSSGRLRPWIRVFGAPILIAISTLVGLLAALLWGEVGGYVAWTTVGFPVFVVLRVWPRHGKRAKPS